MEKQKKTETMLVISTGFIIIYILSHNILFIRIAACIGLMGIFSDSISGWITFGWMKLSEGIGWIMSKVILTIIFYIFLVPIAFASRLFSKDPLQLKNKKESYFTERYHVYNAGDLKTPW